MLLACLSVTADLARATVYAPPSSPSLTTPPPQQQPPSLPWWEDWPPLSPRPPLPPPYSETCVLVVPSWVTYFRALAGSIFTPPFYKVWGLFNELGCGSGCGWYYFVPILFLPFDERPCARRWPGFGNSDLVPGRAA